jgi:hypothetical protein
MKFNTLTPLIFVIFFLMGCQDYKAPKEKGLHFQGRHCIACHNNDLQEEQQLFIGGTLFKQDNATNGEDLNTICNEDLLVNFVRQGIVKYSSKVSTSKGSKGRGNFFILQREIGIEKEALLGEEFIMQITSTNGTILAQSTDFHEFNGLYFDATSNLEYDLENRYSCNSCHTKGGYQLPLYPNQNIACK